MKSCKIDRILWEMRAMSCFALSFCERMYSYPLRPGGDLFFFPKQVCTLFVWGDLDREQISVFDLNSDEINRSVHYVYTSYFRAKEEVMKIALVEIRTHDNKRDVHESDA